MTIFTINGAAVRDIASLYDELNRVFMAEEDWQLGPSLDALNDLLYGGFGALHGVSEAHIIWTDHTISRRMLGLDTTREYYRGKLSQPQIYSAPHFRGLLEELENGTGRTYFDIVLEVFADHPEIELILT